MTRAEIDALDALCCSLDDERPRVAITAKAWGLGFNFGISNAKAGFVSSAASPRPTSLAKPACVSAPPGSLDAGERIRDQAGPAPSNSPAQPIALCVFCALERALAGHGSAPRINGDVWLQPCARHASQPEISREVVTEQSPSVRRAEPPGSLDNRAPDTSPNPNAGIVAAYPKGRW